MEDCAESGSPDYSKRSFIFVQNRNKIYDMQEFVNSNIEAFASTHLQTDISELNNA
ncbi:hypothetical protein SDC9_118525 [bioreactor metagenome]|uniref:Uncharacterized protein n=1 Tax=bioreactor metagenome TaxID=1076179 RepID=A0A645C2H5_9ZZZZ